MFWFVWICGWGLTAAIIALVWIHSRSGRSLSVGVCLGVIAGVLWPITVWVAVGAWLYTREARRAGQAHVDPAVLASQIQQAQAYAQQAEIEGMSSSAEYWRAEAERLTAQQQASKTSISHPAATSLIVVGCTDHDRRPLVLRPSIRGREDARTIAVTRGYAGWCTAVARGSGQSHPDDASCGNRTGGASSDSAGKHLTAVR